MDGVGGKGGAACWREAECGVGVGMGDAARRGPVGVDIEWQG